MGVTIIEFILYLQDGSCFSTIQAEIIKTENLITIIPK